MFKESNEDLWNQIKIDGKNPLPDPAPTQNSDEEEGEQTASCSFYFGKACDKAGTYRCTSECDFHPQSSNIDQAVVDQFEKEPWGIYCLNCGKFLASRNEYGHPDDHVMATGLAEYRDKIPVFVLDIMQHRANENTEMNW